MNNLGKTSANLNFPHIILDIVGKNRVSFLINSLVQPLGSSGAVHEISGDYAASSFVSKWCRLLYNSSQKLARTKNNQPCSGCNRGLCYKSCWRVAETAIKTKKTAHGVCIGGLQIYAEPIIVKDRCIGAIRLSYQNPPKNLKKLKKLATLFKCDYEKLKNAAVSYKAVPNNVIATTKHRLKNIAKFFGLIIENKEILFDLKKRIKELELLNNASNILLKYAPKQPLEGLLKKVMKVMPKAFMDLTEIGVKLTYNNQVFQTGKIKKSNLYLKDKVSLGKYGELKAEIYCLKISPPRKEDTFFKEEQKIIRNILQSIAEVILRKNFQKELSSSLDRFKGIFENASDGILALDLKTQKFAFANPTMQQITGYSPKELIKMGIEDIHPSKKLPHIKRQAKLLALRKVKVAENIPILRKDGSILYCDINSTALKIAKRKYLLGFFRDVTHRLELENALKKQNRHILTLSQINHALVHAVNEKDFLAKAGATLIKTSGYPSTWIGSIEKHTNEVIQLITLFAFPTEDFKKEITIMKNCFNLSPAGKAICSAKTIYINDIEKYKKYPPTYNFAKKHSYHSLIALPLLQSDKVFGVLAVCAKKKNVFDTEEIHLLEEIANDLSYGISTFRLAESKKMAELAEAKTALELRKSLEDTISIVSLAAEKRDPYTYGHQRRVAKLATAIARELKLPSKTIDGIYFGSLIHDLGKIYIPLEILARTGKLTDAELLIMKDHVKIGYDITKNINFIWPIKDIILHHHERINGSGYPDKLKGTDISIECRIIAVADVVEAMTEARPYRTALGSKAALNEIKKNAGILYDPKVVDACVNVFKKGFSFKCATRVCSL